MGDSPPLYKKDDNLDNFIVFQKTYDMTKYGYQALKQFPCSEKHTLAAEIKLAMIKLLKLIIQTHKKYYKKTTLREMDTQLELIDISKNNLKLLAGWPSQQNTEETIEAP
jgi:hypothetical protein